MTTAQLLFDSIKVTFASRLFGKPLQALLVLLLCMPVAWAAGVSITNLKVKSFKQISFADTELSINVGGEITQTAITKHSTGTVSYRSDNAAIANVNAGTGLVTGVGVGETTIVAIQAHKSPYRQATASYKLKVNGKPVTFSPWALDPVIFGVAPFQIKAPTSDVPGSPSITYSTLNNDASVVSITASGQITVNAKGTATVVAKQSAFGEYGEGTTSAELNITAATPTFSWSDQTVQLGDTLTLKDPADSPNKLGAFSYVVNPDISGKTIATVDSRTRVLTPSSAGSATITVTQAAAGDYNEASLTMKLTVATLTFTITGFDDIRRTFDAADAANNQFSLPTLAKPAGSASTYVFTSSDERVASIDGSKVTVHKPGTVTITAELPEDPTLHAKATAGATLAIEKAVPQFTLSTVDTYTGDPNFPIPVGSTNTETPITLSLQNPQPPGFATLTQVNGQWSANLLNPGTATLVATQDASASGIFAPGSISVPFVVKDQSSLNPNTLALAPITKLTNDQAFVPVWTGVVGDPATIQVAVINPGPNVVATLGIDGKTISLTGLAGEAEIALTQPVQNGYQSARVPSKLTVKPAPFEITDIGDLEVDYIVGRGPIPTLYTLPTDLAKPAGSTSNFIFTIDGYSSVASIEGNTLSVHRWGEATMTVTLPADELRHLEAKKQVTIFVEYYSPPPNGPVLGTGGVNVNLTPLRRRVLITP